MYKCLKPLNWIKPDDYLINSEITKKLCKN